MRLKIVANRVQSLLCLDNSNFSPILANPGIPKNTFWAISQEPWFFPDILFFANVISWWILSKYGGKNAHFRTRFSLKSPKPQFGPFGPFLGKFGPQFFFSKIGKCQVLSLPKLQLHAKFQRNSMKGCWENPGQTN